jgi:hypothetical protein
MGDINSNYNTTNNNKCDYNDAGGRSNHTRTDVDNGYDNCKILFMFYVVLFHMANNWYLHESTKDWWTTTTTSTIIVRSFHRYTLWHEKVAVPGFAFISGLFGKKFTTMDGSFRWKRSISMLFFGAMNIQLVELLSGHVLTKIWSGDQQQNSTTIIPTSINFYDHLETWYLLALLCWRFMTPFIQLTRRPLVVALLLALLHVHVDWGGGQSADLRMRVFRFFPFYVAGLIVDKSVMDRIPRPTLLGAGGVVLTMFVAFVFEDSNDLLGITYSISSWTVQAHLIFLFQYVYAALAVISVILLVRQIRIPLLPWSHSNSTLAIYVWHWYVLTLILFGKCPFANDIVVVERWPLMDFLKTYGRRHPILAIASMHVMSYIICVVLGSRFFWSIIRRITDPDLSWIFRKPPAITSSQAVEFFDKQLLHHEFYTTHNNQTRVNKSDDSTATSCSSIEDNVILLNKVV